MWGNLVYKTSLTISSKSCLLIELDGSDDPLIFLAIVAEYNSMMFTGVKFRKAAQCHRRLISMNWDCLSLTWLFLWANMSLSSSILAISLLMQNLRVSQCKASSAVIPVRTTKLSGWLCINLSLSFNSLMMSSTCLSRSRIWIDNHLRWCFGTPRSPFRSFWKSLFDANHFRLLSNCSWWSKCCYGCPTLHLLLESDLR